MVVMFQSVQLLGFTLSGSIVNDSTENSAVF